MLEGLPALWLVHITQLTHMSPSNISSSITVTHHSTHRVHRPDQHLSFLEVYIRANEMCADQKQCMKLEEVVRNDGKSAKTSWMKKSTFGWT